MQEKAACTPEGIYKMIQSCQYVLALIASDPGGGPVYLQGMKGALCLCRFLMLYQESISTIPSSYLQYIKSVQPPESDYCYVVHHLFKDFHPFLLALPVNMSLVCKRKYTLLAQ